MTKMKRLSGVVTAPDESELLSRLMVHGFTQVANDTPVSPVVLDVDGVRTEVTDGTEMYFLIETGCRFMSDAEAEQTKQSAEPEDQ